MATLLAISLSRPLVGLQEVLKHEYNEPVLAAEGYNYAAVCLNFTNGLLQLGKRLGMPVELDDCVPIANTVCLTAHEWAVLSNACAAGAGVQH